MKRLLLLVVLLGLTARAPAAPVTVIDVHGALWPGQVKFVTQQMDKAWQSGAAGIIVDLDTTRGSNEAADTLKAAILTRSRDLPIAAYVHDRALGPGSLVAVACKTLAMSPGASLGNADSRQQKSDFTGAAEATGRNPAIASAFVSADAALPGLSVKPGDSLTLTAKQAASVRYADVIASDYPDVLAKMGLGGSSLVPVHLDTWTSVALWVSQPWATIFLLALGVALVVIEILTLHTWGLAGIAGGLLALLVFAAHIAVGTATWVGIILILAGLALLLFETHVFPGHGISALVGLVLVFVGIYYALGGAQTGALFSLSAALLTTTAILIAFFLYLPRSRVWNKLAQPMRQTAQSGYVSSEDYTQFLGTVGLALTDLRPSGFADLAGERLPVVTEGDFISDGTPVQVVLVQGGRIVVRADDAPA